MAIKIKRSTGNLAPAELAAGQLAYSEGSENGGTLYYGEIGGTVREIGGRKYVDKLNGIEAGAEVNTVDSVNGQTGAVVLAVGDISGAESTLNKGVANGYASLDSAGLVPASQLPSYVDDVVEAADLASFPATGETSKIYVAIDTGKAYRWSGSVYVEIVASPGSTDSLTEGSTNLYYTDARARAALSASQNISYNSTTGAFTGPDLTGYALTSSLATVATSGSYTDLSNKPTLFSGSYTDLTDKPTLFTDVVQDTTPQLGGALDVNGNNITAALDANVNIVVTGTGQINLNHGDTEVDSLVVVGNGVNAAAIRSNGDTTMFIGGSNVVLAPEEDVGLQTDRVIVGTGDAASTITSNGAYNLVLGTNSAEVGASPLVTLTQNGGITLQATAATNSVLVLNSTFQHFMNSYTAASGTAFLQAHSTADANNFQLTRARGTTTTPSAVQTGDELAEFFVTGHDGQTGVTGYEQAWGFTTTVTDTPTSNVMPVITEFVINTAANTRTVYHSIESDLVFRVRELGTVAGVDNLVISAGEDGNIELTPDGAGRVVISGLAYPAADGTANQVLTTDGEGNLSWADQSGGGISALLDDPAPQLGGDLDLASNSIVNSAEDSDIVLRPNGTGSVFIDGSETDDNVGRLKVGRIVNAGEGDDLFVTSTASISMTAASIQLNGLAYPSEDGTEGQVLVTDGGGSLSWADQTAGVTAFTGLSDVPSAFTGAAGYYVKVNSGATALEFSQDIDDGSF
jgi:hypothetical protein